MPPENTFARIPRSVLLDPKLSANDLRVYGVMAANCFNTNLSFLGQRKIASLANLHRRTVRRSLETLASRGHISRSLYSLNHHVVYQLNSPVFRSQNQE